MSRKSTSSKKFVAPRGEDGKFLPMAEWSKATQKEFERLKKQGVFKNPIVKSSSGRRRGKDIWIPPQNKNGQFLPMSQWSAADQRAYKKALKDGLVPGGLVPRGHAGRFATEAAPKSRRSRGRPAAAIVSHPGDADFGSDDVYDIKRGIRRLEHRLEDLTEEFDRATRRASTGRLPAYQEPCSCGVEGCRHGVRFGRSKTQVSQQERAEDRFMESGSAEPPIDVEWRDACDEDACGAEILQAAKDAREACQGSLDQLEKYTGHPHGGLTRNRSNRTERAIMYNRPRSLSRGFDSIIEAAKEHPVLAIVGIGALALVGYALYRWVRSLVSTFAAGTEIRGGVMYFPGTAPYTLTTDDSLWLIRSIWGEVNRSDRDWETPNVQQGSAAVMCSMANNYMTVGAKRTIYSTFGDFVQAYSQPINPSWLDPAGSRCQGRPDMCTAAQVQFRRALRSKPWSQFPPGAQALVTAFVQGTLRNPIGIRTDFRASNTGYRPADAINVANNIFGTADNARRRTGTATA